MNQIVRRARVLESSVGDQPNKVQLDRADTHQVEFDRSESNRRVAVQNIAGQSVDRKYWTESTLQLEIAGPDGKLVVDLNQPFVRIGSHPGSDVWLSLPGVERKHLYLQVMNDQIIGLDFAATGKHGRLTNKNGRPIKCGPYLITPYVKRVLAASVERSSGHAECTSSSSAKNETKKRKEHSSSSRGKCSQNNSHMTIPSFHAKINLKGKDEFCYPFPSQLFSVGRNSANKVAVRSRHISPFHCVIFCDLKDVWVIDLLANNQSRCNGKGVVCERIPSDGVLDFGSVTMEFRKTELDSAKCDSTELDSASQPSAGFEPTISDVHCEEELMEEALQDSTLLHNEKNIARVADPRIVGALFRILEAHMDEVRRAKAKLVIDQNRLYRERDAFEKQLASWADLRKQQAKVLEMIRNDHDLLRARLVASEARQESLASNHVNHQVAEQAHSEQMHSEQTQNMHQVANQPKPDQASIPAEPASIQAESTKTKNTKPTKASGWCIWKRIPQAGNADERQLDVLHNIVRLGRG